MRVSRPGNPYGTLLKGAFLPFRIFPSGSSKKNAE